MDAADLMAVALLAEPTRQRLYLYLRERKEPVGREEAARHTEVKHGSRPSIWTGWPKRGCSMLSFGGSRAGLAQVPAVRRRSTRSRRDPFRWKFRRPGMRSQLR